MRASRPAASWILAAVLGGIAADATAAAACVASPPGVVAWWRAEGNGADVAGGYDGTIAGGTSFSAGMVGQAFAQDGDTDALRLGNPPGLRLQDFTVEAWVRRASATVASYGSHSSGVFLGYGTGGYAFGVLHDGSLFLTCVEVDSVVLPAAVVDTNWHHVAVTKGGSQVVFYVDGVASPLFTYQTTFTFGSDAAVGARGDILDDSFLGQIDELALYNRALSAEEVGAIRLAGSSGKCEAMPPQIVLQPRDLTVEQGGTATFTVSASGSVPLVYQWLHDDRALEGATAAVLVLGDVQPAQAGNYVARVSNAHGSASSASARLTVTLPPATVRIPDTNARGGRPVQVPVTLTAHGNENAVAFSVWFDPNLLSFTEATPGSGAPGASLILNTTQAANGRLGLGMALSAGASLPPGTQEILKIEFSTAAVTTPRTAILTFQDSPTLRQLVDVQANVLPAIFTEGRVNVATTQYEGDVAPRPGGDRFTTIADWVQAGRHVARLDPALEGTEFERADCAPRATLGNGQLKVTDWVQVGRYVAGVDAPTPAGGPTEETSHQGIGRASAGPMDSPAANAAAGRVVQVVGGSVPLGQTNVVSVLLEAVGDENALAFSLGFDPARLRFVSAEPGSSAAGAALNLNTLQAGSGRIGVALARPTGTTFRAGSHELLRVRLAIALEATGEVPITLGDDPVPTEVSDVAALALEAGYVGGVLTIEAPGPDLEIARTGAGVVLSWPAGQGYLLQSASAVAPDAVWMNDPASPEVVNGKETVVLPALEASRFYRLARP